MCERVRLIKGLDQALKKMGLEKRDVGKVSYLENSVYNMYIHTYIHKRVYIYM